MAASSSTGRIVDILVQCDAGPGNAGRMGLAAGLARKHGAHLVGLHVIDLLSATAMSAAAGGDAAGLGILIEHLRADALAEAEGIERAFRASLEREGISGEWRLVEDGAGKTLTMHARHADLVVLGQDGVRAGMGADQDVVIEQVLFGAGRPLLLVPREGTFKVPGSRALIAWNASREATRAAHDALPLLGGAELVRLLAVDPEPSSEGTGPTPGADFARHLARYGLTVEATSVPSAGGDPVDVLLRRAAEMGADMVVLGGYGHTRLREMILGGMTRGILRRMTLPVLMSH